MTERDSRSEIVEKILRRDGDRCALPSCGEFLGDDRTIDHWIPLSKGGTWDLKNLKLMHRRCNSFKGDTEPLPDGTLVLTRKVQPAKVVVVRPEVCDACNSGRLLEEDDHCAVCGSGPQPMKWQQWAKLKTSECPHEAPWHCFACFLGMVPRVPAFVDALGESKDN